MQPIVPETSPSWLSLIAETAGVTGATIARIELSTSQIETQMTRAFVQVVDRKGQVLGASTWYGRKSELARGIKIDMGCDLRAAMGASLIGWLVDSSEQAEPLSFFDGDARKALAPPLVASCHFDPYQCMELQLTTSQPSGTRAA